MPPSQTEDAPMPRSASVIPSSAPLDDAETLIRLFPGRFTLERNRGDDPLPSPCSASLIGTARSDPSVIMLVDFQRASRDRFIVPNATIIIDDEGIAAAVESLRRRGDHTCGGENGKDNVGVSFGAKLVSSSPSSTPWAVIQLFGGGVVVIASIVAFSSLEGRLNFAHAMAKQEAKIGEYFDEESQSFAGVDRGDSSMSRRRELAKDPDGIHLRVPPPLYSFPSLSLSILSDGKIIPGFQANTRVGVPIESDLFVGTALLMLRPPNPTDDMHYYENVFKKKKRRFEIQIQGQFKYVPTGTIFCGFEVSDQMKLGLVSKGLCNVLLKLVSKTVSADMSFSFGDDNNDELPHIAFPAWTLFDKLVVTKPGETPPPLGETLPESAESASARKKSGNVGDWNTQDTYSMSYHSMYLDLPIWHIVNLPMMRDLDLQTFWGDSLLRICVYENRGNDREGRHLQKDNAYLAGIQAEYIGFGDDVDQKNKSEEREILPWDKPLPAIPRSISYLTLSNDDNGTSPSSPELDYVDIGEDNVESDDETAFFDATEVSLIESDIDLANLKDTGYGDDFAVAPNSRPANMLLSDMLCPGWIEMCSERGKYKKVYAFTFAVGDDDAVFYRTASEFGRLFSVQEGKTLVEETCSERLSSSEKLRRIMGHTLAATRLDSPSSRIYQRCLALRKHEGKFDNFFLRRPCPCDSAVKVKYDNINLVGYVGRALSERHWIEEWAIVTDRYITFFHPDSKRPSFRVSRRGILAVKKLDVGNSPYFPTYQFLSIETLTRVVYLMCRSEDECMRWQTVLSVVSQSNLLTDAAPSTAAKSSSSSTWGLLTFDDPAEEFLHKSSIWSCKQRRILNCRKSVFNSLGQMDDSEVVRNHPLALVQDALRKALEPMDDSEDNNLREFLDSAAELKAANVANLNETERMAFFINLYHVMVMHAFLVLGTPNSSFKWISYFNMIAYECSDDIFSLTELEHNIIRARMTSPSQFVAKFVLPKSVYKFALNRADFRINFAINCGSLSNPSSVQLFDADNLEEQLDVATRDYLRVAKVESGRKGVLCVTLPRICQWYAGDFGSGRQPDLFLNLDFGSGRQSDLFLTLEKFLRERNQGLSSATVSDTTIKFLPYDFSCRHLKLRTLAQTTTK